MTLKDIIILMETINKEISNGIDVEFNKSWLCALRNSISKSLSKKNENN